MKKPNFKAKFNTFFIYLISFICYVKMYKKILFIRKYEPFRFNLLKTIIKINFK